MSPVLIISFSLVLAVLTAGWMIKSAIQCRESGLTQALFLVHEVMTEHLQHTLDTAPPTALMDEMGGFGGRITTLEAAVELLPHTYEEFWTKANRAANREAEYLRRQGKKEEEEGEGYPTPDAEVLLESISEPDEPVQELGWEEKLFLQLHGQAMGGE